jgi:uncharacterized protein YlxP (DUF503 family)
MFIAAFTIDLFIPASNSLKHKRQVIRSLKDRLRNNFNVALAEEAIDKWQRARLFIVGVNGKRPHLDKTFSSIEKMLYNSRDIEVVGVEREFL